MRDDEKNAWDTGPMRFFTQKRVKILPFWVIRAFSWAGVPLGSWLILFHFGGTGFSRSDLPWLVMYVVWLLFGVVILGAAKLPQTIGMLLISVAAAIGIFVSLLAWGLAL